MRVDICLWFLCISYIYMSSLSLLSHVTNRSIVSHICHKFIMINFLNLLMLLYNYAFRYLCFHSPIYSYVAQHFRNRLRFSGLPSQLGCRTEISSVWLKREVERPLPSLSPCCHGYRFFPRLNGKGTVCCADIYVVTKLVITQQM